MVSQFSSAATGRRFRDRRISAVCCVAGPSLPPLPPGAMNEFWKFILSQDVAFRVWRKKKEKKEQIASVRPRSFHRPVATESRTESEGSADRRKNLFLETFPVESSRSTRGDRRMYVYAIFQCLVNIYRVHYTVYRENKSAQYWERWNDNGISRGKGGWGDE